MSITDADRVVAWQAQSLLMTYPDERLTGNLALLRRASAALPAPLGAPLRSFLDHVGNTAANDLSIEYVATFDHHKRFSPYLTYFVYGDTRKRGMALLRLKHAYRAAGLLLNEDELPDHLAVMLEFAATGDSKAGARLLEEHRVGVELMRSGLREAGSPWARVLDSVSATLSPLGRNEHEAVARLAAQGPPEEAVGLAPFAPPEYMPQGGTR